MRKSKAETVETRRRIVEAAAREFLRNGIESMGLADLMAEAGLTHGGFYRHFESKDQLVCEACGAASDSLMQTLAGLTGGRSQLAGLKAVAAEYLSPKHRDDPGNGCPLAALGSELARAEAGTRAAATQCVEQFVDLIAAQLDGQRRDVAHRKALAAVSLMVGGLTMARMVDDPELSGDILHEAIRHVLQIAD